MSYHYSLIEFEKMANELVAKYREVKPDIPVQYLTIELPQWPEWAYDGPLWANESGISRERYKVFSGIRVVENNNIDEPRIVESCQSEKQV